MHQVQSQGACHEGVGEGWGAEQGVDLFFFHFEEVKEFVFV